MLCPPRIGSRQITRVNRANLANQVSACVRPTRYSYVQILCVLVGCVCSQSFAIGLMHGVFRQARRRQNFCGSRVNVRGSIFTLVNREYQSHRTHSFLFVRWKALQPGDFVRNNKCLMRAVPPIASGSQITRSGIDFANS